ncbi:cytochrome ubiquinol oxidase subunit I [Emcibacter sp. SYSU 3D8]|uniref:cytochrome ubiquinol oxidase subunit I n=1 Tax=Emcibacter sp. SYSU 3D8 TaxID=3133969 RepID=UPI0031FF3347
MEIDTVLLSRLQFAFTIAFHILFPTLTIGLACFLALVEGLWLKTRDPRWRDLYRFWVRIFALSFGMGVVTGIPMSFQFGTNFSAFSLATGNVLGPLLGYEVLTAFFLEASFLGIMLFGWKRVGPILHYTATLMVAFGTTLSAFWILSANSWMQTPQGHILGADGIFYVASWWDVIFNPSFPYRLAHMVLATLLTMSFVVAAVSAWQMLHDRHADTARKALKLAITAAAILAPLQLFVGDQHGLNTLEHQPVKVAAMEGNWDTGPRTPLLLFALPDEVAETNHLEIGIPDGASLILRHDADGVVPGLKDVSAADRPPVAIVFFAFRIMVGIGLLMIGMAWLGVLLRKRLPAVRPYLWGMVAMGPVGFVATLAGWTVTEVGRQPWTVYGLVRTADSVSPQLQAPEVLTSLMLFAIVYHMVLAAFLYFAARIARQGPAPDDSTRQPALAPSQAA